MDSNEGIVVVDFWHREESQVEGFLNLLRTAAVVVEDLLNLPKDYIRVGGQVSRDACIADLHARDEKDETLLTVEAKTPDLLNTQDLGLIVEKAPNGSWSEGEFRVDVLEYTASMVLQAWCQSLYDSWENDAGQTVTPRYCGLISYNDTILGLRGSGMDYITSDEDTLFITGPLNPKDTFIGLVAIPYNQVTINKRSTVNRVRAAVHIGQYFYPDSQTSELSSLKSENREFMYQYDIRSCYGNKFLFSDPKIIVRGKHLESNLSPPFTPPLSPASSRSQSPFGSLNPSSPPSHLIITAHLAMALLVRYTWRGAGRTLWRGRRLILPRRKPAMETRHGRKQQCTRARLQPSKGPSSRDSMALITRRRMTTSSSC
ncbi:hypothetical protein B0H19DRAFT_280531 [Mycena capillaripes]|nr:hypothetical protein B0H19DRAFT_280531 [Mycena capillaripes]